VETRGCFLVRLPTLHATASHYDGANEIWHRDSRTENVQLTSVYVKKSLMAIPTSEQISTIQDLQPKKYVKEAPINIV